MAGSGRHRSTRNGVILTAALLGGVSFVGFVVGLLALVITVLSSGSDCASPGGPGAIVLGPPGTGQLVGATEYGGPGDPSSGSVGASGASLLQHPDSYAELGGDAFAAAPGKGGPP